MFASANALSILKLVWTKLEPFLMQERNVCASHGSKFGRSATVWLIKKLLGLTERGPNAHLVEYPQTCENNRVEADLDLGSHKAPSDVSNATLEATSLKCLCGGERGASVLQVAPLCVGGGHPSV